MAKKKQLPESCQLDFLERLIKDVQNYEKRDIIILEQIANNTENEDTIKKLVTVTEKIVSDECINIKDNMPQKENTCDKCQNKLIHRTDDSLETYNHRYEVYEKEGENFNIFNNSIQFSFQS